MNNNIIEGKVRDLGLVDTQAGLYIGLGHHPSSEKYRPATVDDFRTALLQAELHWLTAQIERGDGMKDKITRKELKEDISIYKTGYNTALDDLNTPLIERKKEVEGKLKDIK